MGELTRPGRLLVTLCIAASFTLLVACSGSDEGSTVAGTGGGSGSTPQPEGTGAPAQESDSASDSETVPKSTFHKTDDDCVALKQWFVLPRKLKAGTPEQQSTLYEEMIRLAGQLAESQPQFTTQLQILTVSAKAVHVDHLEATEQEALERRQARTDLWTWYRSTCFG